MSEENMYVGMAEGIAGNGAASLRSTEAQAAYFMERAKVEAITQNTKAVETLAKSVDTMAFGIIGELMSLKEALTTNEKEEKGKDK